MVLGQQAAGGGLDSLFRPVGKPMMLGFQTYLVACLDCGYLGACLSEEERSELGKKLRQA